MPPKQRVSSRSAAPTTAVSKAPAAAAAATVTTPAADSTDTAVSGTPSVTAVSKTFGSASGTGIAASVRSLWRDYLDTTPKQLKLLDGFQFFFMLTGVAQFVYCVVVTNFPFNAFLGGFSATVGQFVLAASMRSQVNPKNKAVFPTISPERAFADFVFGTLVLHFFVYNYLG